MINLKEKFRKYCLVIIAIFILTYGIIFIKDTIISLKLKKNNNINIVFTTDSNYINYTKVAIKSAIINKNQNSIYNINIICVDLKPKEIKELEFLNDKNAKIHTIPVNLSSIDNIGNYQLNYYVSRADLFKFIMY